MFIFERVFERLNKTSRTIFIVLFLFTYFDLIMTFAVWMKML